jgi:hypothetical protein
MSNERRKKGAATMGLSDRHADHATQHAHGECSGTRAYDHVRTVSFLASSKLFGPIKPFEIMTQYGSIRYEYVFARHMMRTFLIGNVCSRSTSLQWRWRQDGDKMAMQSIQEVTWRWRWRYKGGKLIARLRLVLIT